MSFDVLSLMGKGLVGGFIVGILVIVLLCCFHTYHWMRRRHPKVMEFVGHVIMFVVVVVTIGVMLTFLGIIVETFFWR